LRDGPSGGGPQVVELQAKLVASFHHALADQCFGARGDHPEVEARTALSRFCELHVLSGEPLAAYWRRSSCSSNRPSSAVDGTVEVVSGGHCKLFTRSAVATESGY